MKKVIFIANIERNPASGIYKKIVGQCSSLSINGECILVCKENGKVYEERYKNKILTVGASKKFEDSITKIIKYADEIVQNETVNILYYRLPLKPSVYQIHLFRNAKKNGAKIFYEIPTYPFFKEQVKLSRRKILTFGKLIIDKIIFQISKRYIDKIPVMISSSKIKRDPKFISISNGIDSTRIPITNTHLNRNKDAVHLIGVGMLTAYHGYERVIHSLSNYKSRGGKQKIVFHIVGDGLILESLKSEVDKLNLKDNVIFHGVLYGSELDDVYGISQIGVGALELYRRNADIDTTLKVVEYLVRGLPVLTSGDVDSVIPSKFIFKIQNNDEPFIFEELIAFVNDFNSMENQNIVLSLRENYNWDKIMSKLIDT